MEIFGNILGVCLLAIAIKSIVIGSEFSFYHLWKHGSVYARWYNSRPKFEDHLKESQKE